MLECNVRDLRKYKALLIHPQGNYELFRSAHPCLFKLGISQEGVCVRGVFNKRINPEETDDDDCLLYTSGQLANFDDCNEYNAIGSALFPFHSFGSRKLFGPVLLVAQSDYVFTQRDVRFVLNQTRSRWCDDLQHTLLMCSPFAFLFVVFSCGALIGRVFL